MEISVAVLVCVKSLLFLLLWSRCEGRESELNYVTCGSLVKLLNTRHNVRLHSHDVKYGSGNFTSVETDTQAYLASQPATANTMKRVVLVSPDASYVVFRKQNSIERSDDLKLHCSSANIHEAQYIPNARPLLL